MSCRARDQQKQEWFDLRELMVGNDTKEKQELDYSSNEGEKERKKKMLSLKSPGDLEGRWENN